MIASLDACCTKEAQRNCKRHRDVAICNGCGRLILCWDNPEEQRKTRAELEAAGVAFAEGRKGPLFLTSKERA